MSLLENIKLALSSLRAGKMRALLTMLGIIIGISSVIAIFTVGNSLTLSITNAMDDLGVNQIQTYVSTRARNDDRQITNDDLIKEEWIDELAVKYANDLEAVLVYQMMGEGQIKAGHKYANISLIGCGENAGKNEGVDVVRGRDITKSDILGAKRVAFVSDKMAVKIFGTDNVIGKEISVHTPNYGILTFTITGVYRFEVPKIMSSFVPDEDIQTQVIIPYTTAKRITGAPDGVSYLSVKVKKEVDAYALTEKIEKFFEKKYENNKNFRVFSQNMEGMMDMMTSMLGTISIAISIIAAISLLVGGIGVMNIMLVSVTERTREIGTRKALGARSSSIRYQFIIESMIICLIGGIIGVILGLLLGWLGSNLLGFPAQPSIPIIIIAVMFSMVIGVFFGFYPANKASKLDPIEALRYE